MAVEFSAHTRLDRIFSDRGSDRIRNELLGWEHWGLGMVSSKGPARWHVVEAPGGWTVKDNGGAILAIVPAEEATIGDDQRGLSRHEAWLLANCIAALPDILLRTARKARLDMTQDDPDQTDVRHLSACLRLN